MLSKEEQTKIEDTLSSLNMLPELQEEMMDHYCSSIEREMIEGIPFEKAYKNAFSNFSLKEVLQINEYDKQLKRIQMIKRMSIPSALVLVVAVFLFQNLISQDNSWHSPIENSQLTRMSSGYGYRTHPITKAKKMHTGVDYVAPLGTPVYAVKKGKVIEVRESNKGYGNYIIVDHGDSIQTMYAQLSEILVSANEEVSPKDTIGLVGSSGTSTGPHLHFECIKKGMKINPVKLDSIFVNNPY